MTNLIKIIIISFTMVLITIIGDYFVKLASTYKAFSGWRILCLGGFLYGISAVGWFYVYRLTKVFTVGAIHSVGVMILTLLMSVLIFHEKISLREWAGIILGFAALYFLLSAGGD